MVILFWVILILMTLLALSFVLFPLLRARPATQASRDAYNRAIYQQQLEEIQQALDKNQLTPSSYKDLKQQIEMGMKSEISLNPSVSNTNASNLKILTLLILAIFFPLFSLSAYLHWGDSKQLMRYYSEKADAKLATQELKQLTTPQLIAKMQAVLQTHSASARGWFLLGQLYSSQNDYWNASLAYAKAQVLQPKNLNYKLAYVQASFFAHHERLTKNALQLLQQILQIQPQNPAAINLLALNAYAVGNYQKAIDNWEQLLYAFPPNTPYGQVLMRAIRLAQIKMAHQSRDQSMVSYP